MGLSVIKGAKPQPTLIERCPRRLIRLHAGSPASGCNAEPSWRPRSKWSGDACCAASTAACVAPRSRSFSPHPQPTVADSFLCRSERIRAFSTLLNRTTVSWRSRSSARSPSSMSGLRQPLHPAIQIKASGENPSFGEYLATAVFHAIADLLLVNIQCL